MKTLLLFYLVLLHLCLSIMIFKTDFIERVRARLGKPVESAKVTYYVDSSYHFQRLKYNQSNNKDQYYLLGDSIAQGLNENNLRQKVINWGIGHNTTEKLYTELANLSVPIKAKSVFLLIGINDIFHQTHTKIMIDNVKGILNHLRDVDKVVIVSVLPLNENKGKLNDLVTDYNDALKALSLAQTSVQFLNIHAHFTDNSGFLKPEYDRGDGLHINEQGYALMTSLLNKGFTVEQ
jgi:lysophospholipase L1-like esterase